MTNKSTLLLSIITGAALAGILGFFLLVYIPQRARSNEQVNVNAVKAQELISDHNMANAYLACVRETFMSTLQERGLKDSMAMLACYKDKDCLTKEVNVVHRMADDTCIQKFPDAKIDAFSDLKTTYDAIFSSAISTLGPKQP